MTEQDQAPRPRGRQGGRTPALTPEQVAEARALWDSRTVTVSELASKYGVPRSTMYGHIRKGAKSVATQGNQAQASNG